MIFDADMLGWPRSSERKTRQWSGESTPTLATGQLTTSYESIQGTMSFVYISFTSNAQTNEPSSETSVAVFPPTSSKSRALALACLFSNRVPEASTMSRETQKKRQTKWNTQEAVCARPVSPIILRPSLILSSFSFTRWLRVLATGNITEITTKIANVKPALRKRKEEREQNATRRRGSVVKPKRV